METACNIGTCYRCDIAIRRKNIVVGRGNLDADLMIIGEAPGAKEDTTGIPYVGKSGRMLQYYLDLYGIERQHIYLTNIIKCKLPANSHPTKTHIQNCREYLVTELTTVKPKVIVLLGNTAISNILGSNNKVNKLAGIPVKVGNVYMIPMYHPAYISRNKDLLDLYNGHWEVVYQVFRWQSPMYNFKPKFKI